MWTNIYKQKALKELYLKQNHVLSLLRIIDKNLASKKEKFQYLQNRGQPYDHSIRPEPSVGEAPWDIMNA
jgi:hypothetical protein